MKQREQLVYSQQGVAVTLLCVLTQSYQSAVFLFFTISMAHCLNYENSSDTEASRKHALYVRFSLALLPLSYCYFLSVHHPLIILENLAGLSQLLITFRTCTHALVC